MTESSDPSPRYAADGAVLLLDGYAWAQVMVPIPDIDGKRAWDVRPVRLGPEDLVLRALSGAPMPPELNDYQQQTIHQIREDMWAQRLRGTKPQQPVGRASVPRRIAPAGPNRGKKRH